MFAQEHIVIVKVREFTVRRSCRDVFRKGGGGDGGDDGALEETEESWPRVASSCVRQCVPLRATVSKSFAYSRAAR